MREGSKRTRFKLPKILFLLSSSFCQRSTERYPTGPEPLPPYNHRMRAEATTAAAATEGAEADGCPALVFFLLLARAPSYCCVDFFTAPGAFLCQGFSLLTPPTLMFSCTCIKLPKYTVFRQLVPFGARNITFFSYRSN